MSDSQNVKTVIRAVAAELRALPAFDMKTGDFDLAADHQNKTVRELFAFLRGCGAVVIRGHTGFVVRICGISGEEGLSLPEAVARWVVSARTAVGSEQINESGGIGHWGW